MKKAHTPAAKRTAKPVAITPVPAETPEQAALRLLLEKADAKAKKAKAKAKKVKSDAAEKAKADEKAIADAEAGKSHILWGGFVLVFIIVTVVGVLSFFGNPDPVPAIAETSTASPEFIELQRENDEKDRKLAEAAEAKAEAVREREAAETQRLADEAAREAKFREELAEANRAAEARETAIREEMLAAIKVQAPPAEAPLVGSNEIEKLSPEKTAALLHLGTPGQGYKPPGHEGGPLVFSLSEITSAAGERIFLPNVNEGRSVSGAPGENIPAPQMKCAMPPGVAQLRWVQTSSPDPKKPGHFFYGLAPY